MDANKIMRSRALIAAVVALGSIGAAWAQQNTGPGQATPFEGTHEAARAEYAVVMQRVDNDEGQILGRITLRADSEGLRIIPELEGLPAGPLALRVHHKADCGTAATLDVHGPGESAGPQHAPERVTDAPGAEEGPGVGELPPLAVDDEGRAVTATLASHVHLNDVVGRSLLIFDSESPQGGQRIACGIIRN